MNYSIEILGGIGKKGVHCSKKTEFKKGHKGFSYWKNKKFSQEHKEKLKQSHKGNKSASGHKLSNCAKKKISKSLKGRIPWNKGLVGIEYMSGKNNHNWKGGITSLNNSLRSSSLYKIWREAVFLRDNFTCQNKNCKFCNNKIGVMLHAHHKKFFAENPKLRFKISNGITYCAEFHLKSKELHKVIINEVNK